MSHALNCSIGLHRWEVVTLTDRVPALVCLHCGERETLEVNVSGGLWV